jgi:mitosis inhibitor protein kinase SWE1
MSSLVRLRLREEVDVLKHLSQVTLSSHSADGRHPNVLAYIDSWEEDEALYIRTELCESGNLARFLWEYGRVFPRLDEARVWKVIVDLSNVSITI